jgi:hypothetical protein
MDARECAYDAAIHPLNETLFFSMDATEVGLARLLHMKRRKSGKADLRCQARA